MKVRELLREMPGSKIYILETTLYSGEAYFLDEDGKPWHVALKALPKHVEWEEE